MGSQQSIPSSPHEKAVLEHLGNMQIEDRDNAPAGHDAEKAAFSQLSRRSEGLSIEVLQSWQNNALKDPKNRFVPLLKVHVAL
jgi:hypothetical protein